jgi:hypothetical protein
MEIFLVVLAIAAGVTIIALGFWYILRKAH